MVVSQYSLLREGIWSEVSSLSIRDESDRYSDQEPEYEHAWSIAQQPTTTLDQNEQWWSAHNGILQHKKSNRRGSWTHRNSHAIEKCTHTRIRGTKKESGQ